jgi:hypothetical protein
LLLRIPSSDIEQIQETRFVNHELIKEFLFAMLESTPPYGVQKDKAQSSYGFHGIERQVLLERVKERVNKDTQAGAL